MHQHDGVGSAGPQWAWRLLCTVTNDGVRVVSRRRVEMTVPPSDPLDSESAGVGFWTELRDADDQALYRRVVADPFEADVEVPGKPGDPTFTRHPASPRDTFAVLIPDLPGADHVSLIRGEPRATRDLASGRPTEVARLPLTAEDAGPSATEDEGEE